MSNEIISEELILARTLPEFIKRPHCRIEPNGQLFVDDTVRLILQVKRSGEPTWATFETRSHTPITAASSGYKISLVVEAQIVEVPL